MELSADFKPSSELSVGQLRSNRTLHDIEQEYLEQWHLLENLGVSMDGASGVLSAEKEDPISSRNSATGDTPDQDTKSNDDGQEKEDDKEWFVLKEELTEEDITETLPEDETTNQPSTSNSYQAGEGENVTKLSPYAEQWHELEQLKASVRSLSQVAGLAQSPQPPPEEDQAFANGLSSGSLSVEALDEVSLEGTATVEEGSSPKILEKDAVAEGGHIDDANESASISAHDSGIEEKQWRNQWFPLRPSAVGEDEEDTTQVPNATAPTSTSSNNDRPKDEPRTWSDSDGKQSPPERSQPDGRDGPDVKRMTLVRTTFVSPQQAMSPPMQSQPSPSGTLAGRDSDSDVSVSSQPFSQHNVTPLEIITRSVPPAKKGANLVSELRQRHAPQLNSDSDTESPVSKLLGPNFRAVQDVLDRLKQDRLNDGVGGKMDEVASGREPMGEGFVKAMSSAASAGLRALGEEWSTGRLITERKSSSETEACVKPKDIPSRSPPSLGNGSTGMVPSVNESHRRFSDSDVSVSKVWDKRYESSRPRRNISLHQTEIPAGTIPKAPVQPAQEYPKDLTRLTSINAWSPLRSGEMLDAQYSDHNLAPSLNSVETVSSKTNSAADLMIGDFSVSPGASGASDHKLPTPVFSIREPVGPSSSIRSSRIAWGEEALPTTKKLVHRAPIHAPLRHSVENSAPALGADSGLSLSTSREMVDHGKEGESYTLVPADTSALLPRSGLVSSAIHGTEISRSVVGAASKGSQDSSLMRKGQGETSQTEDNLHRLQDGDTEGYSLGSDDTTVPPGVPLEAPRRASESKDFVRIGKDQGGEIAMEKLRESDRSASSDDTDDLLNYEPVLEGNRQYLRMQNHPGSRDLSIGGKAKDVSGRGNRPSTLQGQYETSSEVDNTHIKSLHWSLGAGTISPIPDNIFAQKEPQQGKSSTPLDSVSERSSLQEHGVLQEQSLEEDILVEGKGQDGIAPTLTQSRSTTDFSSSEETYRPILYRSSSGNKENRPNGSLFGTSSYGIYDIRKSSGPGSTNRRRKAMGLEPNPSREMASQNGPGMVYISGSSTPSSYPDSVGKPSEVRMGLVGRTLGDRDVQLERDNYMGSLERNEALTRPRSREQSDSSFFKSRQAQDFRDLYHDGRAFRDDGSDMRRQAQASSVVKDSIESHRAAEKQITSDRSSHLLRQYMDEPDRYPTVKGSGRLAKSRRRPAGDSDGTSSQSSSLDKKESTNRKHPDAKTRHRSRDRTDLHAVKSSRLDANISKLSSLVSKSIDESISSSSSASVRQSLKPSTSKSSKRRMTSSSESSGISEFFNYAFMEPRPRSSMKHKIRIRELLKSVKTQDISPITRVPHNTSTESTSNMSSTEEKENGTGVKGENELNGRAEEPSSEITHNRRPEAFTIPISDARHVEVEPKCTCGVSKTRDALKTLPAKSKKVERKNNRREFVGSTRKRDIGVNCPTPIMTRSPTSSSDNSLHAQFEDASTQTEEFVKQRKAISKIERETDKSQRKKATSIQRNVEERGVISQSSPKKSDHIYGIDQREVARPKARERLIPSQNSPDHSIKRTFDRSSRVQVPAWFHPLTKKPQAEQKTLSELKTPSRSRTNDDFRIDVFDAAINSSASLQKLSLQEAFLYAKSKFVKRSQERVARIDHAAREKERRKVAEEAAAEEMRIEASKRSASPPFTAKIKARVKSADQLHVPKPRQMTRSEMKELNQRLYKNLPEVKAKHEQTRRQAFYRTNRLRAQLYDKRVRTRLKGAGK